MLIECCAQERTYLRFYGLLGERFSLIDKQYQVEFDELFAKQYMMIHRLETNKLRNSARALTYSVSAGRPALTTDQRPQSPNFLRIFCTPTRFRGGSWNTS